MTSYSQIVDNIAKIVRDATSATEDIIDLYLKSVLDELQDDIKFPETLTEQDMTIGTTGVVEFSAYDIKTYDILDIRDPNGSQQIITILPQKTLDELQVNQSNTSGFPLVATIRNEEQLNVWPYGTDTTWYVKYYDRMSDFSAASQTFPLGREMEKLVLDGVVAEVLDWKDDNRADKYLLKFERGKRLAKRKYSHTPVDECMQPGN